MYRDTALGICIDLSGSDGNAFALMGYASDLARQLNVDKDPIIEDMMSGDYEHLLSVFERHFPVVTLLNKPGDDDCDDDLEALETMPIDELTDLRYEADKLYRESKDDEYCETD